MFNTRTRGRYHTTSGPRLALESLETRRLLSGPGEDTSDALDQLELTRFESETELRDYLVADALKRWDGLFGQPAWPYAYPLYYGVDGPLAYREGAIDFAEAPAAAPDPDHSDTNTQVEGVDEADLVETDGNFLYILAGQELVVADAWPTSELSLVSPRYEIDGQPLGQYLNGDRLTIISYTFGETGIVEPWLDGGPMIEPAFADLSYIGPTYEPRITVTTLEFSDDRRTVNLVEKTELDGDYVDSRAIGDFVYVLTSEQFGLPAPEILCPAQQKNGDDVIPLPDDPVRLGAPIWFPPPEPGNSCVYETADQYLARIGDQVLELGLPNFTTYGPGGEVLDRGLVSEATDVYKPVRPDDSALISLEVFNVTDEEDPGLVSSISVPTTYTSEVYASTGRLYLFNPDWQWTPDGGSTTSIIQFDLDGDQISVGAVGQVPGRVLNSFSIDEYEGYLRVATSNWWGRETDNRVFMLKQNGGQLDMVGKTESLAPGEQIYSVRFMGDTGYVVTFLRTDPLFVIDLSDPEVNENLDSTPRDRVLGELKIPGFSNYLQAVGDHHLIGIGNDADENGRVTGLQISLFDVSDRANPQRVAQYSFNLPSWAWTEAANDHHAVGYYPDQQVLAIPVSSQGQWVAWDRDGDGRDEFQVYRPRTDLWVFQIDLGDEDQAPPTRPDIVELGTIQHDSEVRRSVYIGDGTVDALYSISQTSVKAHNILAPKDPPLAELHFGQEWVGVPVFRANAEDLFVSVAVNMPDRVAPQVLDVNVGSTNWARDFVNLLESQPDGESGPMEILPFSGIDQIKVVFSEDVLVGLNDLSVRGVNQPEYGIRNFEYDVETSTAVWTLSQAIEADTITLQIEDAVRDMSRTSLNGDSDAQPGGSFVHQFRILSGDTSGDGQVDREDVLTAMAHASSRLGQAGYVYTHDIDGNAVIDSGDAMAIGGRTGTALPTANPPGPDLVVGDADGNGTFDQHDIIRVLQAGKYMANEPATWAEGDWNNDGRFDQLDLVTALQEGRYLAVDGEQVDAVDQLFDEMDGDDLG